MVEPVDRAQRRRFAGAVAPISVTISAVVDSIEIPLSASIEP